MAGALRNHCISPTLQLHEHRMQLRAPVRGQQFSQCVLVKVVHESLQRLVKITLQAATLDDGAGVGRPVEAFHQPEVRFGVADDVAQTDVGGFAEETDSPGAAGEEFDVAVFTQGLHDANEVVFGDAVGSADLAGGDGFARVDTEVEQHTEGVVGMKAELHVYLRIADGGGRPLTTGAVKK